MESRYQSWGRYPRVAHQNVRRIFWPDQLRTVVSSLQRPTLVYGLGRSYGDVCLNADADLIDLTGCDRLLDADWRTGIVRVQAGTTLADLLSVIVSRGWFLPVTPGTKFVTVGGAVANDVHGKNHHRGGTFGRYVRSLLLHRSDRQSVRCSPVENPDLYAATIGGLGLTGAIEWVELQLKAVPGPMLEVETIPFTGLEKFAALSDASDKEFEYTVAWVDCFAPDVRGVFFRGNHSAGTAKHHSGSDTAFPFVAPEWLLSHATIKVFNTAYYRAQALKARKSTTHYDPFFYPLDSVRDWNRIYGERGLLQYQCVVPSERLDIIETLLAAIARARTGSFLAVLKRFGALESPGMLSFPRAGLTLALDFPFRGDRTLALLTELDAVVRHAGGAVYPAKDARMSGAMFQHSFPRWREFSAFVDPKFSSSFWRRVTAELA
jgi:FAD/FMN-containing dehydrogenase